MKNKNLKSIYDFVYCLLEFWHITKDQLGAGLQS